MARKKKDDELTMVDDATNAVQTNEQATVDVSPTDITATDKVTVNAGAAVTGTEPSRKEARQAAQAERAQNALKAKEERRQAQVARRDLYANEAVDLVAKTMQDTGLESVDEQTLSNILTPKQLWYFQRRYNPKSNWGTAAGGRALLGEMNDSTVSELNRLASAKVKEQKTLQDEQDASDVAIKTKNGEDYVVGGVTISNKKLNEMKDWGSQITDPNEITPEQVAQLYQKLESYGVKVPKVQAVDANGAPSVDANGQPIMKYDIGTDNMSLYDIKADLDEADPDDNGDMALDALGFRNDAGELVVPHRKTYEEMLAERAAAKERIDLLNQQKAADRAKLRLGLSDLAAGIGDMIKASGGAIVNPRDYQAKYDALTAQQKENFNNYLARMQKMKDEEKAKQLLKEERIYKEKQDKIQRNWQSEEYRKNREAKLAAAMMRASSQGGKEDKQVRSEFDGNTYTFANKEQSDQVYNEIFGLIKSKITTDEGALMPPYGEMIAINEEGVVSKASLAAIARAAIQDASISGDAALAQKIRKKLQAASTSVEGGGSGVLRPDNANGNGNGNGNGNRFSYVDMLTNGASTTQVPPVAQSNNADAVYVGRNGNRLTVEQWNALPEYMKPNYTLIQ